MIAECRGSVISLDAAQPNDGFRIEVDDRGPDDLRVEFEGLGESDRKTEVRGECEGGVPVLEIRND